MIVSIHLSTQKLLSLSCFYKIETGAFAYGRLVMMHLTALQPYQKVLCVAHASLLLVRFYRLSAGQPLFIEVVKQKLALLCIYKKRAVHIYCTALFIARALPAVGMNCKRVNFFTTLYHTDRGYLLVVANAFALAR